ncbi:MAG: 7,8-didemethyl-8-hydroxy-5-deazariboflavin synthase subunit CofG [Thermoprotei archaeon]|nr:MAG: 7,8-didemethyl-8-hydroxy-5-deazariboflavin synthase subunit CofG [Thermoprotei archaeon]RLF18793.1 MAG: 7,8-didemethyl-8-hydroxy-5-deazariboflavin synthase subunit CofG [Thermoprotei archaeon]
MRSEFIEALYKCLERPASRSEALLLAEASGGEVQALLAAALMVKSSSTGKLVTYSRKVFTPLTRLCRNACAYCGFRLRAEKPFMDIQEALSIVKAGERLKAKEVLVSTGEKPEEVYEEAKRFLKSMGYESTVEYVRDFEERILEETEVMMPHTNIGVLSKDEMAQLRDLNASMGLMLESVSERLMERGMPHEKSPSKKPSVRLKMIREAGELKIPFTTGILVGIGETWEERVDSLLAIRRLHEEHGHIQEVIVQNFMPELGTPMEHWRPPSLTVMLKTIALARLILPRDVAVQAPPNLNLKLYFTYLTAGINDWGGISPLTPDFVNEAYPWPKISDVKRLTELMGFELRERLPIYPKYVKYGWMPEPLKCRVERLVDELGLVRRGEDAY